MNSVPKVHFTCIQCGKDFEVFPSHAKRGNVKFCSISCGTTYKNLHNNPSWDEKTRYKISQNHADVSGTRNPMYGKIGEQSPSYIDGRSSFKGEIYRKKLLASGIPARCSICGSVGNIHVHHKDGNRRHNDLKNLIFACVKCHNTKLHTYQRDSLGRFIGSELSFLVEKERA